jgi:hypothetical protein
MNQLISYDEASGSADGTPGFCERQSYGWTGMDMDPMMYSLIEPNPFVSPVDPGPTLTYNAGFQANQQMKTTEQLWDNDRNYFLAYVNVHRACFRLLDELIRPEYKVSNQPGARSLPYQTTPPIINTGIPQVPTYVGYQAGGTGTRYGGGYGGGFQQGRGSGRTGERGGRGTARRSRNGG